MEGARRDTRADISSLWLFLGLKQDGNTEIFIVLTNHLRRCGRGHFVHFAVSSLPHPSLIYYPPSSFHLSCLCVFALTEGTFTLKNKTNKKKQQKKK